MRVRVNRLWAASMSAAVLIASAARAGDGTVEAVHTDPNNPASKIDHLKVTAKVYVDLPRTQAEMQAMEAPLRGMAHTLCDETDGLVSFEHIDFVNSPLEKANADILWYQRDARAHSSGPPFGAASPVDCHTPTTDRADGRHWRPPGSCLSTSVTARTALAAAPENAGRGQSGTR